MRVVSHKKLKDFYETKGREDAREALQRWYDIAEKAEWKSLSDVNITKYQYEFALARIEDLLPLVDDNTPANDSAAVELSVMSEIVIAYEKLHFPIRNYAVPKFAKLPLEEMEMA